MEENRGPFMVGEQPAPATWARRLVQGMCLVTALVVGLSIGHAAWPDPEVDAGIVRIVASGLAAWKIQTASGNLDIVENTNIGVSVLRVNATDGSLLLRSRTSAQLLTLAPAAANELIVNSSYPALCISTGTGAGAWVMVSSRTSATGGVVTCGL